MAEGLEVVIKYKGQKYHQVNSPNLSHSQEIAILKKDLAHLRVHSPAQKNVRRIGGSFVLHWPTAGTSTKVEALADSLHMRWFKLCSNDQDSLKLRELLSIESITLTQDGILLRSTDEESGEELHPAHGTLAARLSEVSSLPEPSQSQPPSPTTIASPSAPLPTYTVISPVISQPLPPKPPPTGPRSDRFQVPHHPKRKLSNADGPLGPPPTRQKLDTHMQAPQPQSPTSPSVQQRLLPISPAFDAMPMRSVDAPSVAPPHPQPAVRFEHIPITMEGVIPTTLQPQAQVRPHTPTITQKPATPVPESGEVTPLPGTPAHVATPVSAAMPVPSIPPPAITPLSVPLPVESTPLPVSVPPLSTFLTVPAVPAPAPVTVSPIAPSPARQPAQAPPSQPRLSPRPHSHRTSPYPKSASPSTPAHSHASHASHTPTNGKKDHSRDRSRSREHDISRLTRDLWDTRRQLTAIQAREQVILDDLDRLGVKGEGSAMGVGGSGAGTERGNLREDLTRLESELRSERTRRLRAERALNDIERECRAPFVVPALFQAFMSMSELSS